MVDIDDFNEKKECFYRGEYYSVRDNGAVFRHKRNKKRKRPNDCHWTFGKENTSNPYLLLSGVRVHRIVATAFHGEPDDAKYVVDHIDTNCRNNRPDNLRWLSRLGNALKNPITRKKIEYLCGSIVAFLENPSMLNEKVIEPQYEWMRRVNLEEAKNCLQRMSLWANSSYVPKAKGGGQKTIGDRVFKPLYRWEAGLVGQPGLDFASTPWCAQYLWGKDVHFPCCPKDLNKDSFNSYFNNLSKGALFAYKTDPKFPRFTVLKAEMTKDLSGILVMCKRSDGSWAVTGIEQNDKSFFIHLYFGSFLNSSDAEKIFTSKKGLSDFWSGSHFDSWDPR